MSRNMIAANKAIFDLLDEYAERHGERLENTGQDRWIATTDADKAILKNYALSKLARFSSTKSILRLDRTPDTVFALVGFDQAIESDWLSPVEVGPGLLTAVLSEALPRPTATALELKQVVDAQDKRDEGYDGHDAGDISELFPNVRAFYNFNVDDDATPQIILDFVLSETSLSDNWITPRLIADLHQLIDLDLIGVPYMTLARSMLDYDRASVFMALYRCFEALYAYAGASKIKNALNLPQSWDLIAAQLELNLNWRPIEGQSLELLMKMAAENDLIKIRDAISPAFPGDGPGDIVRSASDYLYKLRNSVVHFRAIHSLVEHDKVDWESLCCACATSVAYIYSEIFGSI